jgi:hypothetical protein
MRAVWSFWSRPMEAYLHGAWAGEAHHLMSWVLSFELARAHYPRTALVTDGPGARLLVDGLGLEFGEVSTELDALAETDPGWWALGKLHAYRAQDEPFVHLDSDVFLWEPLPAAVAGADLFTQNPEPIEGRRSYYDPDALDQALAKAGGGWLPEEWRWFRHSGVPLRGDCCGFFGANRVDFVKHYASQAIRMVEEPANQRAWAALYPKDPYAVLYEQYLLSACHEYHARVPGSPFGALTMGYLFDSLEHAMTPGVGAAAGYTHLIAGAKANAAVAARLEARVMRDYPARYERCVELVGMKAAA